MRKTTLAKYIVSSMLMSGLLSLQTAYADEKAAVASPIDALHSALLDNMKQSDTLGFDDRYKILAPVIENNFDTPLISKVILGRYWREMDAQAQKEFVALFQQLTTATYANRFDSYGEHRFSVITIETLKKQRYLVKTELVAKGEEAVSLDYIVQRSDSKWKIISVIANGVNDLSLKRAEYGTVIREKGYESLVEDIRLKIKALQKG